MQILLELLRWNIRVHILSGGPIPLGIACTTDYNFRT